MARRARRASSSARHGHAPGGTRPEVMPRTTGDYSPRGFTQALLIGNSRVENTTHIEPGRIPALLDYELMPSASNAPHGLPHPAEPSRTHAARGAVRRRCEERSRPGVVGGAPARAHEASARKERRDFTSPAVRDERMSLVGPDPSCDADEHRGATPQGGAAERGSLAMMGYRDIESRRGAGFVPVSRRRPERARRVPAGCGAARRGSGAGRPGLSGS